MSIVKDRWGYKANVEFKPAYLSETSKANCHATNSGWTTVNGRGQNVVTVAMRNFADSLDGPNMLSISVADRAANDDPVIVTSEYNMKVDYYGDHYIDITSVDLIGNGECQAFSGNNSTRIQYKYTPVSGDAVTADAVFADDISGTVVANSNVNAILSSSNVASAGYDCATDIRADITGLGIVKA